VSTGYFRLILIAAAAGWGCATTATKYALAGFGPVTMLSIKLAAATAVLWAVLLVRGARTAPAKRRLALLRLMEPALAYGGLTVGLTFTTATNASLLGVTESCFVLVLAAVFLRERIRSRSLLGLVLAVAGVLALSGGDFGSGFNAGDLIVVAGSAAAALYVTLAAKVAPTVDAVVSAGIDMALWLVGRLHGRDHARTVRSGMQYEPAPPYLADEPI
jgi:drug/metabolite transporter (DMT)-like permease